MSEDIFQRNRRQDFSSSGLKVMDKDVLILELIRNGSIGALFDAICDDDLDFALLYCARNGLWRFIKAAALARRINMGAMDGLGRDPLDLAALSGDLECVEILLNEGVGQFDSGSAWVFASVSGNPSVLSALSCRVGAPSRDGLGLLPVHWSKSPAVWSWWASYFWSVGGSVDEILKMPGLGIDGGAVSAGRLMDEVSGEEGLWGRWVCASGMDQKNTGPELSASEARGILEKMGSATAALPVVPGRAQGLANALAMGFDG